jgi:hypothetical protein
MEEIISLEYEKEWRKRRKIWEKWRKLKFIQELEKKIIELNCEDDAIEFGSKLKLPAELEEIFGNGQTLCWFLFWKLYEESKIENPIWGWQRERENNKVIVKRENRKTA